MQKLLTLRSKTGHKHRSAKDSASSPRPSDRSPVAAAAATLARAKRIGRPSARRTHRAPLRIDSLLHSSTCTRIPRYRALIIGLGYKEKKKWQLRGSHNDALRFEKLLREKYGWKDITVMLDTRKNRKTDLWPTKANMEARMKNLVEGALPGDMFVIFYAGHSGQVPAEKDTREIDGYDEHMISIDGQNILDDSLRELLVLPLCNGTRLTAIFDSCHSGTLLDLSLYPVQTIQSDIGGVRKAQVDIERAKRANSLPTFLPTQICAATRGVKKVSWVLLKAVTKLCGAAIRSARIQATRTVQSPRMVKQDPTTVTAPIIVVDTVAGDVTALDLDGNIAASDVSSILTDTLSEAAHGERAGQDQGKTASSARAIAPDKQDSGKLSTCRHCNWLATQRPIVNSFAACLDGQQAGERPKGKDKETAGIMTSALMDLLEQEPALSCLEIKERLQPRIFNSCCDMIKKDLRKKKGDSKKLEDLEKKEGGKLADKMCWQMLQPGSEHDEHLNEPFLLAAPRKEDIR